MAPVRGEERILDDSRIPSSAMRSYALMTPEIKKAYMNFYKTTYGGGELDLGDPASRPSTQYRTPWLELSAKS